MLRFWGPNWSMSQKTDLEGLGALTELQAFERKLFFLGWP